MLKRSQRVNELIKKELGNIILREVDFPKDVLVTLTRVDCSSNLIQAKVYISTLPEVYSKEVFKILDKEIYDIQQILNKRLKMRPVPRIDLIEEKATAEAGRIEEELEKIKDNKAR